MKSTIQFTFDDDETNKTEVYAKAIDYYLALFDCKEYLFRQAKADKTEISIEELQKEFKEILDMYNINLEILP